MKPRSVCYSASGAKLRESKQTEAEPKYLEEYRNCDLFPELSGLGWRCDLADGTDVKTIFTLEEKDALTEVSCSFASAETGDVELPAGRSFSGSAITSAEDDWTTINSVGVQRRSVDKN